MTSDKKTSDLGAHYTSRELCVAADANTLLNAWIRQAIRDLATHLAGRKNASEPLHPYATRAVFAGTLGRLTEPQLLELLYPDHPEGGTKAHDFGKILRRPSGVRGAKIDTLRSYCLQLLGSGTVEIAEVAKGWSFALVHLAALRVIHEARPKQLEALRDDEQPLSDILMEGWVAEALVELESIKSAEVDRSSRALREDSVNAAEISLLTTASLKVLALISRFSPFEALGILLKELTPELNALATAAPKLSPRNGLV